MSAEEKPHDKIERDESNRVGAVISGGLAATNLAILIQLLPSLREPDSLSNLSLSFAVILFSVSIPVLTFLFGCYAVMPRPRDILPIPSRILLLGFCFISVIAIALSIAAFHPFAGAVFMIISAAAFYAENQLETKQLKKSKKELTVKDPAETKTGE
ncbi:hypothetical protein ACNFIC_21270 [Pseudomonas sp. NY15463]|uniref:hypothetical protein n=1 Tax=Pseudomonas sp. NY15463 TaxID=3400361 RepID=UPI003A8BBADE